PALACAYFEDDVLLVERIARHELSAQTSDELLGFRGELHDFLAGEVAHVRVVAFGELLRFGEALLDITKRADSLDDRGERRELLADIADAVAIGCCLGRADRALELLVATFDAFESAAQSGRE